MGLYETWEQMCDMQQQNPQMAQNFWSEYFAAEQKNYEQILENHEKVYEGTLKELAEEFGMEMPVFCGFIDGINSSLAAEPYDLKSLEEDSEVKLAVDFEKLFFNMLDCKADWLYKLPQWDGVLSEERRKEITKEWRLSKQAKKEVTVGRNDPCPCGSGKKYKKCCGANKE